MPKVNWEPTKLIKRVCPLPSIKPQTFVCQTSCHIGCAYTEALNLERAANKPKKAIISLSVQAVSQSDDIEELEIELAAIQTRINNS